MHLLSKFQSFLLQGNERTVLAKKNIIASLGLKCISILISLQVVPLTIGYIDTVKYGIWLTLSSIISWLSFFDLGFAHGFRNRFAEAKAKGDMQTAKEYLSTTYAVLSILFTLIFIGITVANHYIHWSEILIIDRQYNAELHTVFGLLACFFCLNIVGSVFTTMLMADQKPAMASLIQTGGQVLAFITIYVLTKTTAGNLVNLAIAFSGIPCILLFIVSFFIFRTERYKPIAPSFRFIRFSLTKNIIELGGQFFIIMIAMMFIYQFMNIIISRVKGPEAVTEYNIAYKYFNTLNMFATIILTPFWSAFTDAYTKKDFRWMKQVHRKLERMWLIFILPVSAFMLICSNPIYKWWIGNDVKISLSVSSMVAIYVLAQTLVGVYTTLINGTGKVRIQMLIYLFFSISALPVINYGCEKIGIIGALLFPTVVCLFQVIMGRKQLTKIIMNKDYGIYSK